MIDKFPKYQKEAQLGELGVNIVKSVINEKFGWIFKRNHQEMDFGIDGFIEIVRDDGAVTGKMLAVQIKCGASFFSEENRWGYVYRGENKHFNYLSNCPIPVLVLLCNPEKKEVFWECFDPIKIERTKKSWKINIPKRQLIDSRDEILALLPEEVDYYSEFEMFWCVNKIFNENIDITRLIIPKEDVLRFDFDFVISVFKRLKVTKEFAYSQQGKVEILFGGYDDDPRELLEIPEVVSYAKQLGKIIPDLFFFCDMSSTMSSFLILGWCNGEPKVIADTNTQVSIDYNKMREFIDYQSSGLKSITAWLNMSENEYETILNKAIKRLYYNYY